LSLPGVGKLWTINLLIALASAQLETMFAYLVKDHFACGPREVGWILGGLAIWMGGIQGGGIRPLVKRYGERQLVIAGFVLCAIGFAAIPVAGNLAWLMVPLALSAAGRGIGQPSLQGWVSQVAPPAERGAVLGAYVAAASLARVIGPSLAGPFYDLWWPLPFLLAGALSAAAAGLAHGAVPIAHDGA
jgi:DHA1 family tetracycline resistance protein-like MFS transporter